MRTSLLGEAWLGGQAAERDPMGLPVTGATATARRLAQRGGGDLPSVLDDRSPGCG